MNKELLEILHGLKNEICPMITNEGQRIILESNFDRAIELCSVSAEQHLAYLEGKVEAYENTIGGK